MQAETYIDSVLELLKTFGVKSYCLYKSCMYDMTPHTRPLLVTGSGSNLKLQNEMETAKVVSSDYTGPTSIALLITQNASAMGIETSTLIVHLPRPSRWRMTTGTGQAHAHAGIFLRSSRGTGGPGRGHEDGGIRQRGGRTDDAAGSHAPADPEAPGGHV